MRLTSEQIRSAARGVAYHTMEHGLLRLHRFTQAQEVMYQGYNREHYHRTFATAGVVVEFDTDSRMLELSIRASKGSSRHWFVHSIFVNGVKIGELTGKFEEYSYVDATESWQLGQGRKRVTIQFPWSACSRIRALRLDDDALFEPVKKEKTVLIYGDSITQGYDAAAPENSYASQMAAFLDADCINKAIGGAVFYPELAQHADPVEPALITVAYGTNDWSGSKNENLADNCLDFCRNLRNAYPKTKIVLLAPVWRQNWQTEKPKVSFPQIPEIFANVAAKIGNAVVVDCFRFIPQELACYSPDTIHPNDAGFQYYAEGLEDAFEELNIRL